VITQNLKTPIILLPNLSNVSDVKDQHLAGCAGESQGLRWAGMESIGGLDRARLIVSKLALNTDLLNSDIKPKYEKWKNLYNEQKNSSLPNLTFWSNQDLKEIFEILSKGPNQSSFLETSMISLRKSNLTLSHTMAKQDVSKWSDKVFKILNNCGNSKGLDTNTPQYKNNYYLTLTVIVLILVRNIGQMRLLMRKKHHHLTLLRIL
jgi:hypothetical protein